MTTRPTPFRTLDEMLNAIRGAVRHDESGDRLYVGKALLDKLVSTAQAEVERRDSALRVGLFDRFATLDALIDLSDPEVFAARRELGRAVGEAIENGVTAKTWPPYGENGAMHTPPKEWLTNSDRAPSEDNGGDNA